MCRAHCLLLAALVGVTQPSCGLLMGANVNHNSRGTACLDTPAFAIVDMGLGAASVGILAGTGKLDESMAWMIIPGVFFTTGVIGAIFVHRCTRAQRAEATAAQPVPAVYDDTYPVTPTTPPAQPQESAATEEADTPPPAPTGPALKLQLDSDYPIGAGAPRDAGVDAPP